MKTFVGIDLGSTTTKAVLLDDNSQVIGRGITNSRSNYATAARVASEEARVDGRFTLFRRALNAGGGKSGELDEFLGALERAFRLEQFLEQLGDLEETCRGQIKGERFAKRRERRPGGARRGVQASARGGAVALCARRQAQVGLLPRHRRLALSHPCRGGRARRRAALRAPAQCLRQVDHRRGKPPAGRRAQRQVPPRARPRACRGQRGQDRVDRRAADDRSTRSPSISRKPIWSAPATAASRCRSPRSTSARRSSVTGSART